MTVLESPKIVLGQFTGLSTDEKPVATGGGLPVNIGTKFEETDTGRIYRFDGVTWIEESPTAERANDIALQPRSSFIQLFGDTFATTPASTIFLLEDLTDSQGGTGLTNVGGIPFGVDNDLPLRGFTVPDLSGSGEHFEIPTEAKVEVGNESFVAGQWWKPKSTDKGVIDVPFAYGDGNSQYWSMNFDTADNCFANVDNGTSLIRSTIISAGHLKNDQWHWFGMIVDRVAQTIQAIVIDLDGHTVLGNLASIAAHGTDSYDNPGTNFSIGAQSLSGVYGSRIEGKVSNFQLYKAGAAIPPDYNLLALLAAGIRESAAVGDPFTISNNTNARLNNSFGLGNIENGYSTTVINTSEGIYDLFQLYQRAPNRGIVELYIDGILQDTTDHYAFSTTDNVTKTTSGIFLSAGNHIFKVKNNGKNPTSSAFLERHQMYELIKRDGENQGDDESSSGILFSDELDRTNSAFGFSLLASAPYNQEFFNATNGSYMEGDLFLKKGLYKIQLNYRAGSNKAQVDLFFGGVKVLDAFDQNDVSDIPTASVSRFAFIEGGKTTIRFAKQSTDADFADFISCRYELVTGKSNEAEVNIWAADDDYQAIVGADNESTVNASYRWNTYARVAPDALNDNGVYRRYFSGGTYNVSFIYEKRGNNGITDIGFGGIADNIIDGLDMYSAASQKNVLHSSTVTIPRGVQDITFLNQAVGVGGGFEWRFQRLQFTKIATVINAELDDNSDPVHGAMVPLGKYTAPTAESGVTFEFGGIDLVKKYSELKFVWSGTVAGITNLLLVVNDVTSSNNFAFGNRNNGVVNTPIQLSNNASSLKLMSNVLMNNANGKFYITAEFAFNNTTLGGKSDGEGVNSLTSEILSLQVNAAIDKINKLEFIADTNPWQPNTRIDVYGVLK